MVYVIEGERLTWLALTLSRVLVNTLCQDWDRISGRGRPLYPIFVAEVLE
jgi:hypothetical protein